VRIVFDAQHDSVFEAHACRPPDLDQHRVRLILDPANLKMLSIKGAVEDLATIIVGYQFSARRPP
jgi:hypothetical protein